MIKISGSTAGSGAAVERDPWIPLKVTWLPRRAGRPLYLRISGEKGGEIELKVDPASGVLIQAIVIDSPPMAERANDTGWLPESEGLVPIIDRSQWQVEQLEDVPAANMGGRVISLTINMESWSTNSQFFLRLGDLAPDHYLVCGEVRVGVSHNGYLTGIDSTLQ